jgi:hypothetical protein
MGTPFNVSMPGTRAKSCADMDNAWVTQIGHRELGERDHRNLSQPTSQLVMGILASAVSMEAEMSDGTGWA